MKVSLKYNNITNNQAPIFGAGLYIQNSIVVINSSNITANRNTSKDDRPDISKIDVYCDDDTKKNFRYTCLFCTDSAVSKTCDSCFGANSNASCINTMFNTTICFYSEGVCPIEINPLYAWIALASLAFLVILVLVGVSIVLCRFKHSEDGYDYIRV